MVAQVYRERRRHDRLNWLNAQGYVVALVTEREKTRCPPLWLGKVPYYRPHHHHVLALLYTIEHFNMVRFYHPQDFEPAKLADFLRGAPPAWWLGLNRYRKHIMVLGALDDFTSPHPRRELLEWLLEYSRCL